MFKSDLPLNHQHSAANHDDREADISSVILHYTELNLQDSINILCSAESKVSAHFLIAKTGEIFSLVPPEKRAWHAGVSFWDGQHSLNHSSIGIEIENDGKEEFSAAAMKSLLALLSELKSHFKIKTHMFLGHSDIAPLRKKDPGPHFDWSLLAKHGFGIMSKIDLSQSENFIYSTEEEIQKAKKALTKFGYSPEFLEQNFLETIAAFKTHYLQNQKSFCAEWSHHDQLVLEDLINIKIY